MATMIGLRSALTEHFDGSETRTILLRCREAGLLPDGEPGRGHSAAITPTDAAWALLAMISPARPIEAPASARDLASYRCVAWFDPPVGPCLRREIENGCTLAEWLTQEIAESAADPGHRVAGLWLEHERVSTVDPDDIAEMERRPGDRPVLRDVGLARERLEFRPIERTPAHDERGRPKCLSYLVKPELIRDIAAVFAPPATILSTVAR